jgi:hypothetical protein
MNITWAYLIKKFIGLDVIWGARSKKAAGIQDKNNTITEIITFTAPDTITFSSAVPPWMNTPGTNGKAVRVLNDATHPNSNKKYYVTSIVNAQTVKVAPASVLDTMVNSSSLTKITGRIWEVVDNPNLCNKDREGNTMYNTHHKEKGANDGGDVSLVHFDHYHGRIITHTHNQAGTHLAIYEPASNTHIPSGPHAVVDNAGRVVKV